MKKFITTAAFLAASTALANAANALVLLDFEKVDTGGVDLTNKGTLGTSATIATSGGYLNYGTESSIGAETYTSTGYVYYNNSNYINITNAISWNSDWSIALAFKTSTVDDWADILTIGDTTNAVRIESGNKKDNTVTTVGLYGKGIFSSGGGAGTDYVLKQGSFTQLTLVYSQSSASLSLYADGELQMTMKNTSISSTENLATAILLGGGGSSYGGNNQYVGGYDEFAIYDAALTADEISTYLVGKAAPLTIPEPSAFGLLAGVGALALVAARRRRSRAK